jgi:hypothetical protein
MVSFLGLSMAGWNAHLSLGRGVIAWLPKRRSADDPLAPGDRRPDSAFDAARRPGRRIWRDPHLCRAAGGAARGSPAAQAIAHMAAQESGTSPASTS